MFVRLWPTDVSPPLASLANFAADDAGAREPDARDAGQGRNGEHPTALAAAQGRGGPIVPPVITTPAGSAAVEQATMGTRAPAVLVASFDGSRSGVQWSTGSRARGNPSDNTLAVGPDHIVQSVNSRMAIFTKKGRQFDTNRQRAVRLGRHEQRVPRVRRHVRDAQQRRRGGALRSTRRSMADRDADLFARFPCVPMSRRGHVRATPRTARLWVDQDSRAPRRAVRAATPAAPATPATHRRGAPPTPPLGSSCRWSRRRAGRGGRGGDSPQRRPGIVCHVLRAERRADPFGPYYR